MQTETLASSLQPPVGPSAAAYLAGTEDSDGQAVLVRGLRAGEDAAYEALVRAYSGRMLAVARRFLRAEDDARDAVQEAFFNAFRGIDGFDGHARVSTWLHRIVVNACLMRLRTRRRKAEESIDDLLPRLPDDGHLERPVAPWRTAASGLLEREEKRALVRSAIDRLPDNHRHVLLLRDIEELDTEETAAQLGISRAAVKTRLHRARLALRGLLDEHFRAEGDRPVGQEP